MVKHKAEIAVVVSVIAFFTVPVIPTNHYRSTLRVPPLGSRCQADPSGSYCGETFTNGTAYLNSSTYEKLAHDPYSILCGSGVFEGSMVLLTCQLPPTRWQSLAYWLTGYGWSYTEGSSGGLHY